MLNLNTIRPFAYLILLTAALTAKLAVAQDIHPWQVGDSIEVLYSEKWLPATVTEVRDGSVRAAFTDERFYPPQANEIFPLFKVRTVGGISDPSTVASDLSIPAAKVQKTESAKETALSFIFQSGDRVQAWCWGNLENATVVGIDNGQYRLRFDAGEACGEWRPPEKVVALAPAKGKVSAATSKPPSVLEPGNYTCFASIPHYAGSTYMIGIGSIPNYTFTWERVGSLTLAANTFYRSGDSKPAPYSYDAATGMITWQGGLHQGIASQATYTAEGLLEIVIHRKDGRAGDWRCRR